MISIVIPFYNRWELTHARLLELYKFAPDDIEIILVDDASTDENIQSGVAWWQKTVAKHKIRYHLNPENLGFGGAMNEGAKLAKGETLILLSNDVVMSGDIITEIAMKISANPNAFLGGEIIWFDSGWNTLTVDDKKVIIPYCNGWLLACTKEVWDAIGGFDLRYGKYDYEDIDISLTAQSLGYNLIALNSNLAKHIGGATIYALNPDRQTQTFKNKELFKEKWQDKLKDLHTRLQVQTR